MAMRVAAGIVCAFMLAVTAAAEPPPQPPIDDAREVVLAFFENFNQGSVKGMGMTYSDRDDFVWIENGSVAFQGKAAAMSGMEERLAATPGARLETTEKMAMIQVGASAVEAVAPITLYVKGPDGSEQPVLSGVMTILLTAETGEWRILTGHTSTAISMQ